MGLKAVKQQSLKGIALTPAESDVPETLRETGISFLPTLRIGGLLSSRASIGNSS